MQTRLFFVVFLVASLLGTAYGQGFQLDEQGRGIALDAKVQHLMDAADRAIDAAAPAREKARMQLKEAEKNLRNKIADKKMTSLQLMAARSTYAEAAMDCMAAYRIAGPAVHKAIMAYFDNVNAIARTKRDISPSNYGEWQNKADAATIFLLGEARKTLEAEADAAIKAAQKREAEAFRQMQEDFRKMQEADREMRKKSNI